MKQIRHMKWLPLLNAIGVIAVITVNALANILPINGVGTGQVSADYENYFTPAGFTFSIWSVIYLGLLGFAFFQLFGIVIKRLEKASLVAQKLGPLFFLNCMANIAWIFAWHHYLIFFSVLIMILILVTLILIHGRLKELPNQPQNVWLVKFPLRLYLGWICVATVANVAVLLTSLEWNGIGISEDVYGLLLYSVAAALGAWLVLKERSVVPVMAIAWGLFGIFSKLQVIEAPDYMILYSLIMIVVLVLLMLYQIGFKKKWI
jgi:hypothetical protein